MRSLIKNLAILLVCSVLAGVAAIGAILLALYLTNVWVAPLPVDTDASVLTGFSTKAVTIDLCGDTPGLRLETVPNCLEVVNNYGEQKTAPINVLEPKVSDVYLQYSPQLNEYDSTLYFDTATNTVKNGSMQSMVNVINLAKEIVR